MKCSTAFERYLALDKHERVPLTLTFHLFRCPVCRAAVRQVSRVESLLSRPFATRSPKASLSHDPVLAAAMEKIAAAGLVYPVQEPVAKRVSLFRWFVVGVLLAGGFVVLPFSASGVLMTEEFGTALVVPFYILCGCAVTAYGGLFIGTNIDLFIKRFKALRPNERSIPQGNRVDC